MAAEILTLLVAANLAGAAAILAVLALRRPARGLLGPRLAYALWLIVPAAMLASLAPARTVTLDAPAPPPLRPAAQAVVEFIDFAPAALPAAPAAAAAPEFATVLMGAWLAGAAAFLAYLLFGQVRALAGFGLIARETGGIARAANLGAGPAVIGLLHPTIILPADFESRFAAEEQAMILAHERAHLRSGDLWINALTGLVRALNWFNPLIHLAAFYARVDQELACDAAVVERHPGERRTYAQAMLKSQLGQGVLPLGCSWPARSPNLLKERIEMLAIEKPSPARRLMGGAAIAAAGLAAAYAAWAAEPQQLAALSPRVAVTAATPAPRPTTTAESYVLPPPTAAQYAALAANNPMMVRRFEKGPDGGPLPVNERPGGVDSDTALLYGFHVQDVASGPRRSIVPRGYLVEDVISLWLADGSVIPGMDTEVPTGVVSGLHQPGRPIDGTIKYRVQGEDVTVDAVIILRGKAIAVRGLETSLGETAVAEIAGGHIISVSPRLKPMPPEFLAAMESEEEEVDQADADRHVKRLLTR